MPPSNCVPRRRRLSLLMALSVMLYAHTAWAQDAEVPEDSEEGSSLVLPDVADVLVDSDNTATTRVTGRIDQLQSSGTAWQVSEEELRMMNGSDPDRVLARVPGIYVRSENGFGLKPNIGMRGANSHRSRRITLMEDGVLIAYAPYSSPSIFSLIPPTRIVGIDVYRGAAGIVFGPQTLAGAIDFRTRNIPDEPTVQVDYEFGSWLWSRMHAFGGVSNDRFGFSVEMLDHRAQGFSDTDYSDNSNGFQFQDVALRFAWSERNGSLRHRLSVKAVIQHEVSNESYVGLTDADFDADPLRRYIPASLDQFTMNRQIFEIRERLSWTNGVSLTAVAYHSHVRRPWYRTDRFRSGPSILNVLAAPDDAANRPWVDLLRGDRNATTPEEALVYVINDWRYLSRGVQLDTTWETWGENIDTRTMAGIRVHNDSIERYVDNEGWNIIDQRLQTDGLGRAVQTRDLAETTAFSGYVRTAVRWGAFELTPALRFETMSMWFKNRIANTRIQGNLSVLAPAVSLSVDTGEIGQVFAGFHRGFSPPLPQDIKNVDLETSLNCELGFRTTSHLPVQFSAAGFLSAYDNMTSQCTLTAGCQDIDRAFNSGSARVWGVDSAVGNTMEYGRWDFPLSGSYTWTDSRFLNDFFSADPQLGQVETGDAMPYVPQHVAAFSAGLARAWFSLDLQASWLGEMREQAGQGNEGVRTDAQFILDARVNVRPLPNLTLYVRGENLTNATYIVSRRPWGARPNRPLGAFVGAEFTL